MTNKARFITQANNKNGCAKCGITSASLSKTGSAEHFIEQAIKVHGDKYKYNIEEYKNKKKYIVITCSTHGEFIKSPQKHISGQGCPKCKMVETIKAGLLPGGYCEEIFSRKPDLKNKLGCIYYIKIKDVFKIGITINLTRRLSSLKSKFKVKSLELLDSVELPLYEAFKIEQRVLEEFRDFRVALPESTELFSKDVLHGKILKC